MLTVNIDIQDRLINGQTRIIRYIEFGQDSASKVFWWTSWLKSNEIILFRQTNSWVPIEKCETEILIKKGSASPSIKRTQFLLTLVWTSAVLKVQGLSLEQGIIDFDLQK